MRFCDWVVIRAWRMSPRKGIMMDMTSGTVTLLTGVAMYVGVVVSLAGVLTALARFFFKRLDKRLDRIDIRNTQADERYETRLTQADERYETRLTQAERRYEARLAQADERHEARSAQAEERYEARLAQADERHEIRLAEFRLSIAERDKRYDAQLAEFRLSIAERDKRYDAKFAAMITENNRQAEEGRRRMAELRELLAGSGERLSHVEGYLRIGTRSQAEHKANPATSETLTPEDLQLADR